jgi:hypothetical protein
VFFDTSSCAGGLILKKLEEYLMHAAECRDMARTATPAHKAQLENMAETWELAEARRKMLQARGLTEDDGQDLAT